MGTAAVVAVGTDASVAVGTADVAVGIEFVAAAHQPPNGVF